MMRSLTKTTALVCVAALTSGCGPTKFGRASIAEDAQAQMIGLTKQEVLYCAGIPERVTQYGGLNTCSTAIGMCAAMTATPTREIVMSR